MKLTVGKKITIGFGLGIAVLIILFLATYAMITKIRSSTDTNIKAREYRRVFTAADLAHQQWTNKVATAILDTDSKEVEMEFDSHQCTFGKWYYSGERNDLLKFLPLLSESLGKLEAPHTKLHETGQKISALLSKGDRAAAVALYLNTIVPLNRQIGETLNGMYADMSKHVADDKGLADMVRYGQTAIGLIGLIFSLGMLAIVTYLVRDIKSALRRTISELASTSTEIASTVAEHERTASQQAAMVNETTTTMDELGASSRKSAEQSESAVGAAQNATSLTEEGSDMVKQSIEAMDRLRVKVGGIAEQILRLSEQTGQIGTIAEIVKDLATQINMLALNAAVEAARAGEHGKGFAVVASEVRKLAVESKKSADQVKGIIADIQKSTNMTIMSTEEGTKNVDDVAALARKVGEFFDALADAANVVLNNSQQALLNARQQSMAINQVVQATNAINSGARETTAGISQTKIGIQNLDKATQNLKAMI